MGISPIFINSIKTLYKQNTSMITNKGFLSEQIPLKRGLRQGCPPSLPLHVIQGEVTTININNNNSIKGIHIPNKTKQTKISQYADDFNLFVKNQESLNKLLQFFEKLNKATGITINLEKTTVLPINTEDTAQIKKQYTKNHNQGTISNNKNFRNSL